MSRTDFKMGCILYESASKKKDPSNRLTKCRLMKNTKTNLAFLLELLTKSDAK